jgi:hypothetical protein
LSAIVRRRLQRGDAIGSIVVLVALAVMGYFAYKYFVSAEQTPLNCKAQLNRCSVECRRTATEAPQMQACNEDCQRKATACKD